MEIKSSTKFCHYTLLETAKCILDTECLFLSKYNLMNDLAEADLHLEDANRAFVLSFCHSEGLSIPLFYLYAGIDGKGCRIQFTDTAIRKILRNCSVSYVNNNRRLKKKVPSSDYNIIADWVYYVATDGYCEYKSEMQKPFASIEEAVSALEKENRHFFIKNPIWKYEKEFRIVVLFKKDIPYDKVALNYDLGTLRRGVSVTFGPETTPEEYDSLRKEFGDLGISRFDRPSKHPIAMDLLKRNKGLYKTGEK